MAKITLYHDQSAAATCVPNIFIDQYMTRANGEYVKIYLYCSAVLRSPLRIFPFPVWQIISTAQNGIFSGL